MPCPARTRTHPPAQVYLILYRAPGTNIVKEPNLASYLITNTVFIVGVFTFATILALIADDVKLQLRSLRSGNYPVSAAGHIVVLNWNRNAVPLLRHIAMAQAHLPPFAPRPAVVLVADKAKADMDAAIADGLRTQRLEVHTRRGEPYRCAPPPPLPPVFASLKRDCRGGRWRPAARFQLRLSGAGTALMIQAAAPAEIRNLQALAKVGRFVRGAWVCTYALLFWRPRRLMAAPRATRVAASNCAHFSVSVSSAA